MATGVGTVLPSKPIRFLLNIFAYLLFSGTVTRLEIRGRQLHFFVAFGVVWVHVEIQFPCIERTPYRIWVGYIRPRCVVGDCLSELPRPKKLDEVFPTPLL